MFARVLVPLDGSPLAEAALPVAESIRREFGSVVTLIHLIEKRPPRRVHGEPHLRGEEEARRYLDRLEALAETRVRYVGVGTRRAQLIEVP